MADARARFVIGVDADLSGAQKVERSLKEIGRKSRDLGNDFVRLGAVAAAAGAAMAAAFVKSGLESVDALSKAARSMDATIGGLRATQLAFGEAGVASDTLNKALLNFNARLGEAQRGTGEAYGALERLGLSAEKLAGMDIDQRMAAVSDRIRELGLSTAQTSDILRDFGVRMDGAIIDALRQGGDAIRAAREDVDALGLTFTKIDGLKVEMANDAMGRLSLTLEAVSQRMAISFAPILKVLSDRFNQLAKDNKGFGDIGVQAAEKIVVAVSKLANVIQGLRVVFKGLELVGQGAWAAIISGVQLFAEAFTRIVDGVTREINSLINVLNVLGAGIQEIPSLNDSAFMQGLGQFADEARNRVGEVRTELHELAMQEMPGDKILRFMEDVKAQAQEAAEAVASTMAGSSGESGDFANEGDDEAERRATELEKQREALQAKLDQVMEFAMAEDELEIKRHEERLMRLSEGLALELITVEEARATMEALEEEHMKRLADIRKRGWSDIQKFQNSTLAQQVSQVSGYLANITANVARENKAMFEINKAAGIANAIVSAYEGISKTLGAYPYPFNLALAAAHAVAAFSQVAAIKSQSFSSGGGAAPSLAGGTPATPVTPVNGGTPASAGGGGGGSVLTIEGVGEDQLFSGRTIRNLAERLQEHLRDGGTVQFA